jgi:hypothetical protein
MIETAEPETRFRTEKNVSESDGTLILNKGEVTEGTLLTHEFAVKHGKPCLIVQLDVPEVTKPDHVVRWIDGQYISNLNIAGPRESKYPAGIYADALGYLEKVFNLLKEQS